jgi:hypothetical protein
MDHQTELALKRLETLHQAVANVARFHPDSAEAAEARAAFDAEVALVQVQSAERVADSSLAAARAVARATWALAFFTLVLAAATVVLVFVTVTG